MDAARAGDEVWVLKVPNYVVEAWNNAPKMPVGTLIVEDVPGQDPKLKMELVGSLAQPLPKRYDMMSEDNCALQVFSQEGDKISVKGQVEMKLDAKVAPAYRDSEGRLVVDKNFARITREKVEEEKRKVQANTLQVIPGRPRRPLPRNIPHKRKTDKEDGTSMKRSRLEKDELERELFRMFEKDKYLRLATLQTRLNQPNAWLKEVLNEIAVLNRSGPNLGQYELKNEYKTSVD
ncbi:unnamed protein product [Ostreobium quekettii]|uniref:Transcription initiation factor IIF subunit beta n=1 Tax=Ostreobium quekettii TaxID=121088 RepID=A0A8S1JC84_9CHLO|nr:unnamed protein product [Ostreobium quekettii]|eukprot:evm.model.scf_441EXC.4 EVM.evm.TU.scf_441EXC.4   scf_441EXC:20368-24332(-)